jgi:hypothetical protein
MHPLPLASSLGDIGSIVGAVVAVIGVPLLLLQLHRGRATTEGQLLLTLVELGDEHKAIHARLRSHNAKWWASTGSAPNNEDYAELEAYMGFFERIWVLVDNGSLKLGIVDSLYAYRVANIIRNRYIRTKKLIELASGWAKFIELWRELYRQHRGSDGREVFSQAPPSTELVHPLSELCRALAKEEIDYDVKLQQPDTATVKAVPPHETWEIRVSSDHHTIRCRLVADGTPGPHSGFLRDQISALDGRKTPRKRRPFLSSWH